jgi:NAD(P)-dependent dehydrogenase (short-subunit alcohol dehydrogenase family)
VNNFGIFEPKSFEDIADAEWVRFFEANVLSGVRLARLYLPAMRRRRRWSRLDEWLRAGASRATFHAAKAG